MTADDIRDLDRRAVQATVHLVSKASVADLSKSTPCAGWTLSDLLSHMIGQHNGFAAAAEGRGANLAAWDEGPLGDDPAAEYSAAASRVIAAFAEPGVLERRFVIPAIVPDTEFPAAQAISFHFIDYVVHGWDVARALGVPCELDSDLVEAALPVAEAVPDGKSRLRPGSAFRPGLPIPQEAAPLDRIVAMLGRSPAWPDGGN